VVWQAGIGVPPGGRLLLGYVAGPADAAANLQVFGASASEGGEGRALRLSLPAGSGAR
jgi:hypothetical protein